MRRFLILSLALVCLTCACRKPVEPKGTITAEGSTQVANTGGYVKLHITSNVAWTLVAEPGVTVSPSSGIAGEHIVIATIAPNTEEIAKDFKVTAILTNTEGVTLKKEVILSIAALVPDPMIRLSSENDYNKALPFYGFECKFSIESNCDWIADANGGVVVNPASGVAGKEDITITLPANETKQKVEHQIRFIATNKDGKQYSTSSHLTVDIPYVSDGDGNQYKIVRLKDGRIWMAENMRVLPKGGLTLASSDIGWLDSAFYCPLVIGEDGVTVDFSRKDEDIKRQGLYYSTARAFGLEDDSQLTAENAASFEGCQGICPDGWHIPTAAEMIGLIGKGTKDKDGIDISDYSAPYYDSAAGTTGGGSLAKLNEDGANFKAYSGITISNTAAEKGTMGTVLNSDNSDFNTGYFIGSTLYKVTPNTDGTLKNLQFFALTPNVKQGTLNVSYNHYRSGVSLRCIKNAE